MSIKTLKFLFHWLAFIGLVVILLGNFVLHRLGIVGIGMGFVAASLIPGAMARRRSR